jgi:hypothetical protein
MRADLAEEHDHRRDDAVGGEGEYESGTHRRKRVGAQEVVDVVALDASQHALKVELGHDDDGRL